MTTPAKQLKKDRSTGGAARLWALAALLLAAALFLIGAARSRIREINGGEEDDLSQY